MNEKNGLIRNGVSSSALPIGLLLCSAAWLVSAGAYYATSGFRNDWSATPLFCMLTVMVTPAISFAISMMIWGARQHSRFSPLESYALAAAVLPVTLGTVLAVWAVAGLFWMSGMGI
jgi:hypothetical protein